MSELSSFIIRVYSMIQKKDVSQDRGRKGETKREKEKEKELSSKKTGETLPSS